MADAIVKSLKIYSDGASKGNPGAGAIGVLILDQDNKPLEEHKDCIGHCTNNEAEYKALIKALDLAAKHCRGEIYCYLDSKLVIKHLNGTYRLKKDQLRELYHQGKDKERPFKKVIYTHTPDTDQRIKRAHKLAHDALNGR